MTKRSNLAAAVALGCAFLFATDPASALGLKDCSDKYSASKSKKTFAEFQATECGPDAKPVAAPAAAAKPAAPTTAVAPAPTTAAPATTAPAADTKATDAKAKADAKAAEKAAAKAARAEKRKADKAAAATNKAAADAAAKLPIKDAVYPTKIADEFKSRKPSKARFATCLAQYKVNKATNANGGMKWIQKSGGYYSACNKKLKA